MSDDSGEKTEQPTDKKLEDLRKKGQVPSQKSLLDTLSMTIGIILIVALFGPMKLLLQELTDAAFLALRTNIDDAPRLLTPIITEILVIIIFYTGSLFFLSLLIGLLLNKFNFSTDPLVPKFEKLNPISGLKNILSSQALINLFKMSIFFIVIFGAFYYIIWIEIEKNVNIMYCGLSCSSELIIRHLYFIVIVALSIQILMGLIDNKLQRTVFIKQQKMTKDDVKRERKQSDGDPLIKGARRSIAMSDHFSPTLLDVTHVVYSNQFLVAIAYNEEVITLPYVVLKASGENTERILAKIGKRGKKLLRDERAAQELFEMAASGNYLPARSAGIMVKFDNI